MQRCGVTMDWQKSHATAPKGLQFFHVLTIIIYRDFILRNTTSFCYCKLAIGEAPLG